MKIRKYIKKTIAIGLIFTLALSSTACTKKTEGAKAAVKEETQDEKTDLKDDAEGSDGVQKIKVAWQTNSYPLQYEDEDGNLTGYEIEVLKLVDEALPQYEFEFGEPTSQDAQYAGLSAGKYDLVISNAFYTEDRDKAYALPENPLGASLVGIILPKGTEGVTDFASAAEAGLKLSPILAGDGLYYVVYKYNEENPDNPIELEATDSADSFMNSIGWVAEGRYDFAVWPKNYYEQLVTSEDGELHDYDEKLDFYDCRSVYTYPIIRKDEPEVAEAISEVLGKLREEGKLTELSEKFYGYDAFKYDSE